MKGRMGGWRHRNKQQSLPTAADVAAVESTHLCCWRGGGRRSQEPHGNDDINLTSKVAVAVAGWNRSHSRSFFLTVLLLLLLCVPFLLQQQQRSTSGRLDDTRLGT